MRGEGSQVKSRANARFVARQRGEICSRRDLSRNINLEAASINLGPFVINGSWLRRIPCRGSRGFSIDFFSLSLSLFFFAPRFEHRDVSWGNRTDLPPPISEMEVKRRETVINARYSTLVERKEKKREREKNMDRAREIEISGIRVQDSRRSSLFNARGGGIRKLGAFTISRLFEFSR